MKYLIPMAGGDSLFPRNEFHFPKPLIEIDGEPMIAHVIKNLRINDPEARFIFVIRQQDCAEFGLDRTLEMATDGRLTVIPLARPTAGAACSALLAAELINDDEPLIICNADQLIEADLRRILHSFQLRSLDAAVITFPSVHPRWSYVRVDPRGQVTEAAEKRVISRRAIAGFYYFRKGRDFIRAAQASIINQRATDGIYYISLILNEIILDGLTVGHHDIYSDKYHSFYSPQRIEHYEKYLQRQLIVSRNASVPQSGKEVAVIIPMAGLGSRFSAVGHTKPKPFIDVGGRTMIERVMENIAIPNARYILIARREHMEAEPETVAQLKALGNVEFISIDQVTEGAACTVLFARPALDPSAPILIANCDQILDFNCENFITDCNIRNLDGSILVFKNPERDNKWSFARVNEADLVSEVREKQPISEWATVGLYYFARSSIFVDAALDMIINKDRVNNEFYVAPVYNYAISSGSRIGIFEIDAAAMHGIGTPEDLEAFLQLRYLS